MSAQRAGAETRPAPSAQGSIATKPFAHLIVYALEKRLNGTLELTEKNAVFAEILLVGGMPAKVRTRIPVAYLGQVLYEQGAITIEQLNRSLLEISQKRCLQGDALLAVGAVNEQSLIAALAEQTARKLHYLFSATETCDFAYYADCDLLADFGRMASPIDPLPTLWRAMKETPPSAHVDAALINLRHATVRLSEQAQIQRLDLDRHEKALVEAMRPGFQTVTDICGFGVVSTQVAELLIYTLLITRQLDVRLDDRPAPGTEGEELPKPRPSGLRKHSLSFQSPAVPSVPPMPAPPSLPPTQSVYSARKSDILRRAARIERENHFERLGIPQTATLTETQQAFFRLAKLYHPDTLPPALRDVREACALVFAALNEAHHTLSHSQRRRDYEDCLRDHQNGPGSLTPSDPLRVAGAANDFQAAEIRFAQRDFGHAAALLKRFLKVNPHHGASVALLSWIEFQDPAKQSESDLRQRLRELKTAILFDSACARAYHYRAVVQQKLGDHAAAAVDFRAAVRLDSGNTEALRELRLYEMRGQKSYAPKTTTSGLFEKFGKK